VSQFAWKTRGEVIRLANVPTCMISINNNTKVNSTPSGQTRIILGLNSVADHIEEFVGQVSTSRLKSSEWDCTIVEFVVK
jgi:hypothetical protein